MKAVYIRSFGGPENLEVRDVPEPPPPSGTQVLVRVRAAGLNRTDLLRTRARIRRRKVIPQIFPAWNSRARSRR